MGLLYSNFEANPITNNSISINAVSGTLAKTFRKSFFKRFHMQSNMAKYVFDAENPKLGEWGKKEIVVLQTMLCGDGELLAEIIYKEDYDEMFNCKSEREEKCIQD